MANLWEDLPDSSNNAAPTSTAIVAATRPQDLVIADLKYERALEADTNELAQTMFFSKQLTDAVFRIADYVPNLQPGRNSDFWKTKVKSNHYD
jgi:hypothetical protein